MLEQRSSTVHVPPGGPYCSEDLGTWYVAVEDCGYAEARKLVRGTAEIDSMSMLVYQGQRMAYLWDELEHDHDDGTACEVEGCRYVMAWTFSVEER